MVFSVCLSVSLNACLFNLHPQVYIYQLSVCLLVCLSMLVSIDKQILYPRLSIFLSGSQFVFACLLSLSDSGCLSIYLSIYMKACLFGFTFLIHLFSVCLSLSPSVCPWYVLSLNHRSVIVCVCIFVCLCSLSFPFIQIFVCMYVCFAVCLSQSFGRGSI